MCLICELKKATQDAITRGEEIHRELALEQAQVNINNAEAVGRLVKAMESLIEYGYNDLADRVALQLERLLPKREERRSGDVGTASETAPTVDEFEGMPAFIKAYVLDMRAKGIDIEVRHLPL